MSRIPALPGVVAVVLSLCLLATDGCGFRLRGTVDIPESLSPIYIEPSGGSSVVAPLVEQLGGQSKLAPSAAKARLILRIQERQRSRVAATDSSGKVLAYDLHLYVTFSAATPSGETKVPTQKLDLVRTFDNPDVEVLGKQLEQTQIYNEMAADAADRILLRLRTGLR